MSKIEQMFDFQGKTTKLIGSGRAQAYREIYNHLSEKQDSNELPIHENYLGDNELAQNIYTKKYFLKDLDNNCIEKSPEDVFKRLASFLATSELSKTKQKKMG